MPRWAVRAHQNHVLKAFSNGLSVILPSTYIMVP